MRSSPSAFEPGARLVATAAMAHASVAAGVTVVGSIAYRGGLWWESVGLLAGSAASTLLLTLGLAGWHFRRPRSLAALGLGTVLAAGANATLCAALWEGIEVAPFVATFGVVVWGPVGLGYAAAFAALVHPLRSVEAQRTRDVVRRRASVAATWLGAVAFALALAGLERGTAGALGGTIQASAAALATSLPVLTVALGVLALDVRDLAFLRRVARGEHPGLAFRAATPEDDAALLPFVAGLRPARPRWVLVETLRAVAPAQPGAGPFREPARERARYTVVERAAPLRRRLLLSSALAIAMLGIAATTGAFLVERAMLATLETP